MDIDDLKLAWCDLDTRLQQQTAFNLHLLRERSRDAVRDVVRGMLLRQSLLALLWGGIIALLAPFWIEHRAQTHLLVFGVVLHLYAVVAVCNAVLQILLIVRLQYVQPVLVLQRRLLQLRTLRIVSNRWLSLPWWLLWGAAFVVGVKWWSGVDVYLASPTFVWATFAIGACGLAATLWWARRRGARGGCSGFVDDLCGGSLRRALHQLDELARYERG